MVFLIDRFRHRLVIGASDIRPNIGALSPVICLISPALLVLADMVKTHVCKVAAHEKEPLITRIEDVAHPDL